MNPRKTAKTEGLKGMRPLRATRSPNALYQTLTLASTLYTL